MVYIISLAAKICGGIDSSLKHKLLFSLLIAVYVAELQVKHCKAARSMPRQSARAIGELKMRARAQSVMNSHTMYEVLYTMYCTRILCALFLELLELLPVQWVGGALL